MNSEGLEFLIYCDEAAMHGISTATIPANKGFDLMS